MSDLTSVIASAGEVQEFCQSQGWKFCFIGGIAIQRWGSPRFTRDVDLTLLTGFGSEADFIDGILKKFSGRLINARQFAIEHRVLLVQTSSGIPVDFALGAFPFEEASVERASSWIFSDHFSLVTCSAEDLVIHKVFAARDRDWSDVEGILARQFGHLDLSRIRKELPPLLELKEDAESFDRFEHLVATVEKRLSR